MAEEYVRNRMTSPSINFPQTAEEAHQALVMRCRKLLFRDQFGLNDTFTIEAGLGTHRTQQQADWLNQQQSLLRARLEDFLDALDLESRI